MTLCIIPARGGSKRIKRKNIKLFNDQPIIAYSIIAAKNANCFNKIIVSTDDEEIAQIAQHYGAEIPFIRPQHLSNDFATTGEVIAHAIDYMKKQSIWYGQTACCIYATAPFICSHDLQNAMHKLQSKQADFVFPVCHFPFPIQRALQLDEHGQAKMFHPHEFQTRSQDLTPSWHDAGQFYWGTTEAWLAQKPIFNSNSFGIPIPRYRVQDIDTEEDWQHAEILWRTLQATKPSNNE